MMRLTIKIILMAVLVALGGLLLANGLVGWRALNAARGDTEALYEGQVVPQRELKIIADAYAVFVVDASHKVRNGNFTWAEGLASVTQAKGDIARNWELFRARPHTDAGERALIDQAAARFRPADAGVAELLGILQAKDAAALDDFVKNRLYQTIDPVSESITRLIDLGVQNAGKLYVQTEKSADNAILIAKLLIGLGIAGIAAGLWAVLNRVVRPLEALTGTLALLAQEDYRVAVPGLAKQDEVGDMARAIEVLKAHGAEAQRLRADQERQREEAELLKRRALESMAQKVESETRTAVDQVAARAGEMDVHAGAMAVSAERVAKNSHNVAAAAQQALHNAETVASAAEELSASIREISGQVAHASAVSRNAVTKGQETQQTILSLSDAVARIGDVVHLISDIASQTNLLALNATIEAARAGDAGKGFAVVASEVKNLATQTSRSTEEITRQITEINGVTSQAVAAVQEIGRTIEEMDNISGTIAAAIEEQGAATQEISRNVLQAADAAREVSSRITEVSAEAGSTGDRAGTVRGTVTEVTQSVTDLRSTLVRVVRTSMSEVDRRVAERVAVDMPTQLEIGGRRLDSRLRNLSSGGALTAPVEGVTRGAQGRLHLPDLGAIGFSVLDISAEGIHLLFGDEAAARATLAPWLARQAPAAA
ncbi:methyl-accepting chemotaxis protein [Niveispirillum sp. BGYR6]|uniref:methyl-accepting chemotaxis protein n=1 Tax=Niveispirillum sp. BGYR6 TaxID=2971249 RepID=UPI0022B9C702|nr:methyl-accepting chemotaxis protein [Niveispirillum sp. BGYR6]MDG5497190.1 methyl-accepting chemotaxis protein [Niveispirillum sp. BGYR6]